ncbi:SCO family protein [Thermomonas sp. HDW16]|uniref:SCO family protein n=1 Tax=Thermomonas sp. HDW16 TaxID=2714945 RepID=UPI00140C43C3|nr:SCO family protein [Thermomonas sp. HDW16]QIL20295.1 SCO family protein [Thermomonas sp. HDW16]
MKTTLVMKTVLLTALLSSTIPAAARDTPLPTDSVYQLQAQLVDQDGRSQAWRALRGKPRLVAMFYTSCQYICPLIVDSGKAVEHQLTPAERNRLGITLVSMDPARDTPKALRAVVDKRKLDTRHWSLLAPRKDDVRDIAGVLGVRYRALADGEFNHSSAMILLDADGRVLARSEKMGTQPDPEFVATVRRATAVE